MATIQVAKNLDNDMVTKNGKRQHMKGKRVEILIEVREIIVLTIMREISEASSAVVILEMLAMRILNTKSLVIAISFFI